MRNVPIAEFKDNASAWIAAAEAGEDIVITRHGKPTVRLTAAVEDRKAAQRAAVERMLAFNRERQAAGRPSTTIDEIVEWKNEGRR